MACALSYSRFVIDDFHTPFYCFFFIVLHMACELMPFRVALYVMDNSAFCLNLLKALVMYGYSSLLLCAITVVDLICRL